jgi:hypothetical protein
MEKVLLSRPSAFRFVYKHADCCHVPTAVTLEMEVEQARARHSTTNARKQVKAKKKTAVLRGAGPPAKQIRAFLQQHPGAAVVNPRTLTDKDRKTLEEVLDICWDCKKGLFAQQGNSKVRACQQLTSHWLVTLRGLGQE